MLIVASNIRIIIVTSVGVFGYLSMRESVVPSCLVSAVFHENPPLTEGIADTCKNLLALLH
jgi:hypothetical protein